MGGGVTKPRQEEQGLRKQASQRQLPPPKKKQKSPKALLIEAVSLGKEKEASALLEAQPELINESLDADGMRPLQIAARAGHFEVTKTLLAKGTRVTTSR